MSYGPSRAGHLVIMDTRIARILGRMPQDYLLLGLLSSALQAWYLSILPITFEGDAGAYYGYALYLVGDPRGSFAYFRPPGFPLFMAATGLTWLRSFDLAVAAQAVMGAAVPLLVYAALRPLSRMTAFTAAALVILSGVSYSYAKLFTPDQVNMFCVAAMVLGVARFTAARRPRPKYAIIALGSAVAALMMRNEGLYLGLLSFVVLFMAAWPDRRLLKAVALTGAAAFAVVMAWSVARAAIMGDPAAIGSLSNYSGHQLFIRVYATSALEVRRWRCAVVQPAEPGCASGRLPLVLFGPENGPATRRLLGMVRNWAVMSGYDPERFLAEFASNPTEGYDQPLYTRLNVALNESLRLDGYEKSDELLMRVVVEAVRAHPDILYGMIANASSWFGISFEALVRDLRSPRDFVFPFFEGWGWQDPEPYEVSGINAPALLQRAVPESYLWRMVKQYEAPAANAARVARMTMAPELWQSYEGANEASMSRPLDWQFLTLAQTIRGWMRNVVGFVLFLGWPVLLFARPRLLSLYVLGCIALCLAAYSAGFGWGARYQHLTILLMIVASALWLHAVARIVRVRLMPRLHRR